MARLGFVTYAVTLVLSCGIFTAVPANAGKVGLAWSTNNPQYSTVSKFITPELSFYYNWDYHLASGQTTGGLSYAPMLWGNKDLAAFKSTVVSGFARYALGFNEPDLAGQANLSPGDAANLWKQYLEPLRSQGYRLISPATTTGTGWLTNFNTACAGGCNYDAIAVHAYAADTTTFEGIVSAYRTFGKNVWVTEFACQDYSGAGKVCTQAETSSFMAATTSWMQEQSWITAYFWFAPMTPTQLSAIGVNPTNALVADGGVSLTALGQQYIKT
ncbi:hypothetical protein OF83DRAFT_562929 [Amylostereum chailletii]|nr:hypothetical protein OF83DRAFT_562929 [Amylostereum chailletii]